MKYGGSSQYGGTALYGGTKEICGGHSSWCEQFYVRLRDELPPGVYTTNDEDEALRALQLEARTLELIKAWLWHLARNIFPHDSAAFLVNADPSVETWTTLFRMYQAGRLQADRQLIAQAHWRASELSTLPALRGILYPALQPQWLYRDTFDHEALLGRWAENDPNSEGGAIAGAGFIRVLIDSPLGGVWDALNEGGVRFYLNEHWPDPGDEVYALAEVQDVDTTLGCAGGPMLYFDNLNAVRWDIYWHSGDAEFKADLYMLADGVASYLVTLLPLGASPFPFWAALAVRNGNELWAGIGATPEDAIDPTVDLTLIATDFSMPLRYAGLHLVGTTLNDFLDIGEFRLKCGTPENNVEIVEVEANSASPDSVFQLFVKRNPLDDGDYDLASAQRILDIVKPGHVWGTVGESDAFLTDDDFSLTDRDILGE